VAEHDLPAGFEDAVRAGLASLVDAGPQPDDVRLDALESRAVPSASRRTLAIILAVAVVLALLGVGTVVTRAGEDDEHLATANAQQACGSGRERSVALPAGYRDEPRLLYPLSVVTANLGAGGPAGTPTRVPGDGRAEVRYSGGDVIHFTTGPGDTQAAAPSQFPTTRAEADAELEERIDTITSGMTASGKVTTVETPVPISRSFLESTAREAAELPESMATALARGTTFPPIRQSFAVGGATFDRTIEFTDGVVHVSTDLTSAGKGGLRGDGGELGMLVGARRPLSGLEFAAGGRYQWVVFVPAGLDVELITTHGDHCASAVGDALTGGSYWLVQDGNGDQQASLQVTTKGAPDHVTLSKYLG
jgi:hypothetical protein